MSEPTMWEIRALLSVIFFLVVYVGLKAVDHLSHIRRHLEVTHDMNQMVNSTSRSVAELNRRQQGWSEEFFTQVRSIVEDAHKRLMKP